MYTVRTYINIGVLLCRNTRISTNINPFEVPFRAVHQANSVLQGELGLLGTTARYEETTVG